MYYINACSSISHQSSFQTKNWAENLKALAKNSELIIPNYKDFIDRSLLRRMSSINRMGLTCAIDCTKQSNETNPDAIIVGTGLGCLADTEKFLKNTLTIEGLIPPTAFIQSTHNTVAGQISLRLKNHNYNITHTQNSLSFEHALIDGLLCLEEGSKNILLGTVDEKIPLMDDLVTDFNLSVLQEKLTSGASFFMLSQDKSEQAAAYISACTAELTLNNNTKEIVLDFLTDNDLTIDNIDLVMYNTNGTVSNVEIEEDFKGVSCQNYEPYCGYYFTNSAFGLHLANEHLSNHNNSENPIKTILLYNNYNNENIGLIIVKSIEA